MSATQEHEIFIVDDSRVQLILMEKVLKKAGFLVQSFTNGYRVMDFLKKSHPSLIISDIDMPGMNGFQLIQNVRAETPRAEIPFFLISTKGGLTTQERAEKAGAQVFIQKPFKYHILIDVIREMLVIPEIGT